MGMNIQELSKLTSENHFDNVVMNLWRNTTVITKKLTNPKNNNNNKADLRTLSINTRDQERQSFTFGKNICIDWFHLKIR